MRLFVFLAFPAIRIQLIIPSILPAGIGIGYELTAAWKDALAIEHETRAGTQLATNEASQTSGRYISDH